ncbi:MAG: hypothetical protein U1D30_13905 [Planctomycetota bacterium]
MTPSRGAGNDSILGGTGTLTNPDTDTGNDSLVGRSGNDLIFGGAGNDFIHGDTPDGFNPASLLPTLANTVLHSPATEYKYATIRQLVEGQTSLSVSGFQTTSAGVTLNHVEGRNADDHQRWQCGGRRRKFREREDRPGSSIWETSTTTAMMISHWKELSTPTSSWGP